MPGYGELSRNNPDKSRTRASLPHLAQALPPAIFSVPRSGSLFSSLLLSSLSVALATRSRSWTSATLRRGGALHGTHSETSHRVRMGTGRRRRRQKAVSSACSPSRLQQPSRAQRPGAAQAPGAAQKHSERSSRTMPALSTPCPLCLSSLTKKSPPGRGQAPRAPEKTSRHLRADAGPCPVSPPHGRGRRLRRLALAALALASQLSLLHSRR